MVDPDRVISHHGVGVTAEGRRERSEAGAHEPWRSCDQPHRLARHVGVDFEAAGSRRSVGRRWSALIAETSAARNGRRVAA
jgi:hypothetical protein